jgi:hypothetical protein
VIHHLLTLLLAAALPEHAAPLRTLAFLAQQGGYGFWSPIIDTLKAVGLAASGAGLTVAILMKGVAATNGDRHALAAKVAEGVFAGLFLCLLGWFLYDRMVEWTPL